jgi:hypothetical protein
VRGWLFAGLLVPGLASAEGVYGCRWVPGGSAVEYAASEEADVRALLQGAPLVDAEGRAPSFAALSSKRPLGHTASLYCRNEEAEPAEGLLEITFSRRVGFGASYTLASCQLFYRCPAASHVGARVAPLRRLTTLPCPPPAADPEPNAPPEPSEPLAPEERE